MKLLAYLLASLLSLSYTPSIHQISGEVEFEKQVVTELLYEEMIVWRHPTNGSVVEARSCREHQGGCYEHIRRVVDVVYDVAATTDFDPHLILAIAKHETNLNPFAINETTGASGLLQLMPHSPFAEGVRFIHDPRYRNDCRQDEHYCQEEVILQSLTLLARSEARCGSLERGLGLYGSGSCDGSRRFSRYVLRRAEYTKELAREKLAAMISEQSVCPEVNHGPQYY